MGRFRAWSAGRPVGTLRAFHMIRIFIILPLAGTIIGLTAQLADRWGLTRP